MVHFCGGLAAVLHACGVPIHKALPPPVLLGSTRSRTQPDNANQSQLELVRSNISDSCAHNTQEGTGTMAPTEQHQASLGTKREADKAQLQPKKHSEQVGNLL